METSLLARKRRDERVLILVLVLYVAKILLCGLTFPFLYSATVIFFKHVFSEYKWPPNLQSNRFLGIYDTFANYLLIFLKSIRMRTTTWEKTFEH